MARVRRLGLRLFHALRPDRAESDLARQIAAHLVLLEDEYRQRGMSPGEARMAARRTLGVEQARRAHRDARSLLWLDELLNDVRQAWRTAVRNRRSTATATLILTVVAAVTALVLGIADAVLFRSLPYRDPHRVHVVRMMNEPTGQKSTLVSNRVLQLLAEPGYGISAAGLMEEDGPPIRINTPDGPTGIVTASATPGYFEVLGVQPALGRLFSEEDVETGRHVALLAHATWVTRFGGAEDVVGRSVPLGNTTLDVVGVLPPAFFIPLVFGEAPEVFVAGAFPTTTEDNVGAFHPVVRLRRDVTLEQAQAALTALAQANRPAESTSIPVLEPVRAVLFPAGQTITRWLVVCAATLVALAAVNLAGLLLVRGFGRARETGVKLALGASRTRIVRPVLLEVVGMSIVSGATAFLIARSTFDWLLAYVPRIVYGTAPIGVNARVAFLTVAFVGTTAALATVASAWFSTRRGSDVLIRSAGGGRSSGSIWQRGRVIVAVQTALTVVLVFGAAVTARAFMALLNVPLGFDATNVVDVSIRQRPGEAPSYERILRAVQSLPDVMSAGAVGAGQAPFQGGSPFESVQTDDGTVFGGARQVLPGYFDAVGLRLTRGRMPTWNDYREDGDVAIVTEAAATALAPGGDALGRTFTNGRRDRAFRVVGVVSNLRHGIEADRQPAVYTFPQGVPRPLSLMIRTTHRSDELLQTLQQVVRDQVPGARVQAGWWADSIRNATVFRNPRFQTIVLTTLGAVALMLTTVGIAGVLGALVASRTKELAVRAAIGATPGSLVRLVIRQGLVPVAVGIIVGLIATRWAAGFAEAQLFAVDTQGVGALVTTTAAVMVAALAAAWIPSRRAGRIDPVVALRAD